ncbi:Chaperone required for the assembly of the F1-ATPase [Ensifer adhaerens]|nr:Chaperone required for the assembly of the F1-ATPase [Ensifer adhaerens]
MRDILTDLNDAFLSDPDPVRRAQIQMKTPLPKRFYDAVSVGEDGEGGFSVLLDGKTVRTPSKAKLSVPTQAAADMVAAEWAAQKDVISPLTMPVTRLVNTVLDGVAVDPQAVFEDILRYSSSDLLCYRADAPQKLVDLQADNWEPILGWASDRLGARFILAEGVMHQEQPREAIAAFGAGLKRHDDAFRLACLHTVTTLTGSAILALAFAEQFADADEVWRLAHVDEDWQISQWGDDEEAIRRRAARKIDLDAACRLFKAL